MVSPRRVALLSLVLGMGIAAHAETVTPAQSHRVVDRLGAQRVISWQAVSRERGGAFVLLRIGASAREIARVPAVPGAHDYRFVDESSDPGSVAIVYRLAYIERSGAVRSLHEAVVTERRFEERPEAREARLTLKGLAATVRAFPAPPVRAGLTISPITHLGAPRPAPESPPPWG